MTALSFLVSLGLKPGKFGSPSTRHWQAVVTTGRQISSQSQSCHFSLVAGTDAAIKMQARDKKKFNK